MARNHRRGKRGGSSTKPQSWWERRTPGQKWVFGIFVGALASALTAGVATLYTDVGHAFMTRITPPTPTPDPITVAARVHPPDAACEAGVGWIRPTTLETLRSPANMDDNAATVWYLQHGLIPASGNYTELTVQNRPGQSVVLNGLGVQVSNRRSPQAGIAGSTSGGCGAFSPRYFIADLDQTPPRVIAIPGFDVANDQRIPVISFPYVVADTATPEVFRVKAYTGTCDCDWEIELSWVAGGRTGITQVMDHGKPFRTSATAAAHTVSHGYCYGCLDGKPYRGPLELIPRST
jgi:hypothetical protein